MFEWVSICHMLRLRPNLFKKETTINKIINLFFAEPPTFFFAENPFVCNCHLQWFKHLQNWQTTGSGEGHLMQQYPVVGDMDLVGCRVLNHTDTSATHMKPIARVRDDEFLCPYDKPVCVSLIKILQH